jgi:hypothetical protein
VRLRAARRTDFSNEGWMRAHHESLRLEPQASKVEMSIEAQRLQRSDNTNVN